MEQIAAITRTQVRLPCDLMEWLKECAEKHDRSMNGELVAILRDRKRAEDEILANA